jgi:anaphase-promoting complex subunit 8
MHAEAQSRETAATNSNNNNTTPPEGGAGGGGPAAAAANRTRAKAKGRADSGRKKAPAPADKSFDGFTLPELSQRSLFLALYAKFMAGEKRKTEDTEMVMGPQDLGTVVNKQAAVVGRLLTAWFEEHAGADGEVHCSQGWLEYL